MGLRAPVNGSSLTPVALDWGPSTRKFNQVVDLQCGRIVACDHLGSLTVLAGENVVVVDTAAKKVFRTTLVESAVGFIRSAQFCLVRDRLLLALGGKDMNYAGTKTDLLDTTALAKCLSPQLVQNRQVPRAALQLQTKY